MRIIHVLVMIFFLICISDDQVVAYSVADLAAQYGGKVPAVSTSVGSSSFGSGVAVDRATGAQIIVSDVLRSQAYTYAFQNASLSNQVSILVAPENTSFNSRVKIVGYWAGVLGNSSASPSENYIHQYWTNNSGDQNRIVYPPQFGSCSTGITGMDTTSQSYLSYMCLSKLAPYNATVYRRDARYSIGANTSDVGIVETLTFGPFNTSICGFVQDDYFVFATTQAFTMYAGDNSKDVAGNGKTYTIRKDQQLESCPVIATAGNVVAVSVKSAIVRILTFPNGTTSQYALPTSSGAITSMAISNNVIIVGDKYGRVTAWTYNGEDHALWFQTDQTQYQVVVDIYNQLMVVGLSAASDGSPGQVFYINTLPHGLPPRFPRSVITTSDATSAGTAIAAAASTFTAATSTFAAATSTFAAATAFAAATSIDTSVTSVSTSTASWSLSATSDATATSFAAATSTFAAATSTFAAATSISAAATTTWLSSATSDATTTHAIFVAVASTLAAATTSSATHTLAVSLASTSAASTTFSTSTTAESTAATTFAAATSTLAAATTSFAASTLAAATSTSLAPSSSSSSPSCHFNCSCSSDLGIYTNSSSCDLGIWSYDGDLENTDRMIIASTDSILITGEFTQADAGYLIVYVPSSQQPILSVREVAILDGDLIITITEIFSGRLSMNIAIIEASDVYGQFSNIQITQTTPDCVTYKIHPTYGIQRMSLHIEEYNNCHSTGNHFTVIIIAIVVLLLVAMISVPTVWLIVRWRKSKKPLYSFNSLNQNEQ